MDVKTYRWPTTNKVSAKIGLMYIHDYVYSYYDGKTEESRGNPKNNSTAKTGWLFLQKDGYNTSYNYEWLITRFGVNSGSGDSLATRFVIDNGGISASFLHNTNSVRPVFYLLSEATIKDGGDGTKTNPFILNSGQF